MLTRDVHVDVTLLLALSVVYAQIARSEETGSKRRIQWLARGLKTIKRFR